MVKRNKALEHNSSIAKGEPSASATHMAHQRHAIRASHKLREPPTRLARQQRASRASATPGPAARVAHQRNARASSAPRAPEQRQRSNSVHTSNNCAPKSQICNKKCSRSVPKLWHTKCSIKCLKKVDKRIFAKCCHVSRIMQLGSPYCPSRMHVYTAPFGIRPAHPNVQPRANLVKYKMRTRCLI